MDTIKNFNNSKIDATNISLNTASLTIPAAGDTRQLTATLTPNNATNSITRNSSNTSVVTVTQDGLVTNVYQGMASSASATITATTDNGLSATCSVLCQTK